MDLVIKQNINQLESGNSALLDLLYNLTKPNPATGQAIISNATLVGRISVPAAYEDAVNFLNTHFSVERDNGSDFQVFVLNNNYYIRFADSEVESVLKNALGKAEGEGITVAEASNTFANYFQNNTDIESFDELKHFKTGSYNFNGCTNLESVDITDKYGSFNNCTNLVNWYGGKKPDGYLYIGNPMSSAQSCPGLTELEIGEEAPNLYNQQFSYSENIEILRCKPVVNYEFGYPAFRLAPVKNIYIENMDNWLTCRTYGSGMMDSNTKIFYNDQLVTSVEVPQTITQIGASNGGCFGDYSYLTSVQFHSGITSIAQGTFSNCTNLVIPDLNLPNLTSLGSYAFQGTKVQTISDLGSVTSIPEYCFKGCSQLTTIDQGVLDNITVLGKEAFNNCTNLGSAKQSDNTISSVLRLPNLTSIALDSLRYTKFTEIADLGSITTVMGFSEMTNLTSVVLPQTCTAIGQSAFVNDKALTTINLNNITNIGISAFNLCENLMYFHGAGSVAGELNLSNVTSIGKLAFQTCKKLTSLTIGNSATSIGEGAFQNCSGLTSVTISNAVTSIGASAFSNCKNLTHISIPDSVTTLNYDSFRSCDGLLTVEFGTGIQNIGATAFYNNWNIQYMIFHATTPPDINHNSPLGTANQTFPIYVPDEYVNTYKQKENWSTLYSGRIKPMSEFPNS